MHLTDMHRTGHMIIFLLICELVSAQQEPGFISRANLVPVPTLVRDTNGQAVYGLRAKNFIIQDDGVEQAVHLDETAEVTPISLMITVQCGRRAKREFGRMAGLASMLAPILDGTDNEAALLFFDSKLNLAVDFTNESGLIGGGLKNLQAGDGGAAVLDAVAYSARLLAKRPEGRLRVLLLISETRDHGSRFAKLDDVVQLIGATNTAVSTLPFSPYISQQLDTARGANQDEWSPNVDVLEKLAAIRQAMRKNTARVLASLTGGEYQPFETRDSFETNMISFTNHLRSRYQLSFEPRNPHPGLHQIRVRLREQGANEHLLFRTSYWAVSPH
jgi:VWFA-related protein